MRLTPGRSDRVLSVMLCACIQAGAVMGADTAPATAPAMAEPAIVPVKAMLDGYYERLSAPHHLRFTSLDAWKSRRSELRRMVLRDIGLDPMPERLPLKVTYGGSLDRGEYTVQRVYWQTWPDVYASGYLYRPKTPGRHPAILNPHGHWDTGARHAVIQSRCISLARKGYVNLAPDSVHMPMEGYLIGVSSVGVMTFNAIRALDLLESLPEVDASRIGCTGESGGGQQTMFLMGVDDRLAAAAPVVMVTWYRRIMNPPGFPHCYCNIVPGIVRDVDEPEMTATYAPRPTLYLCVTGDWTRDFPKEEYPELESIHALYGARANIGVQQWASGHDYSKPMRERMYAFFNKHLKGVDDPAEALEPELKTEPLETLDALNRPPAGARPKEAIVDWYRQRYTFKPADPQGPAGWQEYQRELLGRLAELLGNVAVRGKRIGPSEGADLAGHKARRVIVQSEAEIQVPIVLATPDDSPRSPLIILIHEEGLQGVGGDHASLVGTLLAGGVAVAVADVRLTGELKRKWPLDCILWGRPEVGMATTDLRACLDVLGEEPDVDARRVTLIGLGRSGITALFAGALEPRFLAVAAPELGPTYIDGRKEPLIANLLRLADLPQLAAATAPRGMLLGSVRTDAYGFAAKAYLGSNAESGLQMREAALTSDQVAAWTLARLRN